MNKSALQHQISNALATHGRINGMTQDDLAIHIGVDRRIVGQAIGYMTDRVVKFGETKPYLYKSIEGVIVEPEPLPDSDPFVLIPVHYKPYPFWTFWFAWPVAFTMFGMLINYIRYS